MDTVIKGYGPGFMSWFRLNVLLASLGMDMSVHTVVANNTRRGS